jgi:MFS-type transporter involved in bile tolerance (Atg22 family)
MAGFVGCAVLTAIQPIAVWTLLPGILLGGMAFGAGRVPTRTELMRAVAQDRVGRTFGAVNAFGLAASVVATLVVATVVGRHGIVPGFITLALIGGIPAVLIGVSLIASKTWSPVPERAYAVPVNPAELVTLTGRKADAEPDTR